MKQTIFILLMCLNFLLSQNGWAQSSSQTSGDVYIEGAFFPVYVKKNDAESSAGGSVSKSIPTESGLGYDVRFTAGYVAWQQVLFGLSYNMYSVDTSRARTGDYEGLTTKTSKTDLGPTVGWMFGGLRLALTYIFYAQKKYDQTYTDPTTGNVSIENHYANTNGSGFQFAASYGLNLGTNWTIGPTLIYREVHYGRQSLTTPTGTPYGSTSTTASPIDAQLQPMVTVAVRF
jgi:hypothetical protein